ncbi:uncharacterized protein V6R79_023762 [Siganus canaliculatus]
MKLYESMRGCRWRGSAGVGVLLLLVFSLVQSVSSNAECPEPPSVTLPQPSYQETVEVNSDFLASLVNNFLNIVQPNEFPQDLILEAINNELTPEEITRKSLTYEVGFLVCAGIGILYILLMPFVGCIFACCRCCGNCGGKKQQKQTSSISCRRRTIYVFTFVITAFIFAGNVCMFKSNQDFRTTINRGPEEADKILSNISTFVTSVPEEVRFVVNQSYRSIDKVAENLDAVGTEVGPGIVKNLNGGLEPAESSLARLGNETKHASAALSQMEKQLSSVNESLVNTQSELATIQSDIRNTITNPSCDGCNSLSAEVDKLTLDTSIPNSNLNELKSVLDEVMAINLSSTVKEVEASIPDRLTNATKQIVEDSKQQLENAKVQISQVTDDIFFSTLTDVSDTLDQLRNEIDNIMPEIEKVEFLRWSLCVLLCCFVLLVVLCYVLGLILGPLGCSSKKDPSRRSCTSECGGIFFMMGAGFSFVFSWLLMIVVVLLFVSGGNVYQLVCRPFQNGQLLQFIDDANYVPEIGPQLGLKSNISISDIYSGCAQNQPVWTVLHLNEVIDLDDLLNVTKYTDQIEDFFKDTVINVPSITLLSTENLEQLDAVSNATTKFNSTEIENKATYILDINFNTTAEKLEALSIDQRNTTIRAELEQEARELRSLQSKLETETFPTVERLSLTITTLKSTLEGFNATVAAVKSSVAAAQNFLDAKTSQIVDNEIRTFAENQLCYLSDFAEWANLAITQQAGRCGPVAGVVDSTDVIFCLNLLNALNAFWFSLGWCLIFFIPGIILSIKLAKHYRKMRKSDSPQELIFMNPIPRAHTIYSG